MSVNDGIVIGVTQIRDRGPESLNWNLVITGDGFTAAEQGTFESAVDVFMDTLFATPPFDVEVDGLVNVFRLDVHSNESGADNPATCPDSTTPIGDVDTIAATYFDASFCNLNVSPPVRRLMDIDDALVMDTVNSLVPEWNCIVVIVNHQEYGGAGFDNVAVYSLGSDAATAIHELGHSAFDLADEYDSYRGCGLDGPEYDQYTGLEPLEPNVTINTDRATLKWASLIDPTTPIPTTENADCTVCDPQGSPVAAGTVGLFEGAYNYHCDVYRPEYNCKMRATAQPFCAVCADKIAGVVRQSAVMLDDCFVATAVYRDRHHPDVQTIRHWRDRHMLEGARGRAVMIAFAGFYRVIGPPLAQWVIHRPVLSRMIRNRILAPFARWLRSTAE